MLSWSTVQENHHCALTFAVLSKRGANLFCRFTREEFFAARKLLIDAILGTDMHHHFALTQELLSHNTVFQAEEDADRTLLVSADCGHGVSGDSSKWAGDSCSSSVAGQHG
jgi:hypothetical protein